MALAIYSSNEGFNICEHHTIHLFDIANIHRFICLEGVDPMKIAALDESEYPVESSVGM